MLCQLNLGDVFYLWNGILWFVTPPFWLLLLWRCLATHENQSVGKRKQCTEVQLRAPPQRKTPNSFCIFSKQSQKKLAKTVKGSLRVLFFGVNWFAIIGWQICCHFSMKPSSITNQQKTIIPAGKPPLPFFDMLMVAQTVTSEHCLIVVNVEAVFFFLLCFMFSFLFFSNFFFCCVVGGGWSPCRCYCFLLRGDQMLCPLKRELAP